MPMPPHTPALRNAMTIDVEDYFQVSAFAQHAPDECFFGGSRSRPQPGNGKDSG